jgi:hypothetical protein
MKGELPKPIRSTPEAVWTHRAEAPKASLVLRLMGRLERLPRRTWILLAVLTACLAIGPFIGLAWLFGLIWLSVLLTVTLPIWGGRQDGPLRPTAPLLKMQEELGLERAWPAYVTIVIDKVVTGEDEGLITFEDGMLRYYGLHTTFRLSTNVAHAPATMFENGPFERDKRSGPAMGDHAKGTAMGCVLRDHPNVHIWFRPKGEWSQHPVFYRQLYRWLTGPEVKPDNSILPPLELQHGRRPDRPFTLRLPKRSDKKEKT